MCSADCHLTCSSLMISDVEHVFICLFTVYPWQGVCSDIYPFLMGLFVLKFFIYSEYKSFIIYVLQTVSSSLWHVFRFSKQCLLQRYILILQSPCYFSLLWTGFCCWVLELITKPKVLQLSFLVFF